jgi:hypothetical protein
VAANMLVDPTNDTRDTVTFLTQLEREGLRVDAALWVLDPVSARWNLFVACPVVAERGPKVAYETAQRALAKSKVQIPLSQVKMIAPTNSLVASLRGAIKVDGWGAVRLQRSTMNGQYFEDAVLLRS